MMACRILILTCTILIAERTPRLERFVGQCMILHFSLTWFLWFGLGHWLSLKFATKPNFCTCAAIKAWALTTSTILCKHFAFPPRPEVPNALQPARNTLSVHCKFITTPSTVTVCSSSVNSTTRSSGSGSPSFSSTGGSSGYSGC